MKTTRFFSCWLPLAIGAATVSSTVGALHRGVTTIEMQASWLLAGGIFAAVCGVIAGILSAIEYNWTAGIFRLGGATLGGWLGFMAGQAMGLIGARPIVEIQAAAPKAGCDLGISTEGLNQFGLAILGLCIGLLWGAKQGLSRWRSRQFR